MSIRRYVISKKAVSDIEEIWMYTVQNWSVEQADRYYNLIFDEVDFICKNPDSGRSYDFIHKDYRASKIKSHLIFYKVTDEVVQIIRILHEHMDIEDHLLA